MNIGLLLSFIFAIMVQAVLPIVLAFIIIKKLKASWTLISVGSLIYISGQALIMFIPDLLAQQGIVLFPEEATTSMQTIITATLMIAIIEETCRYVAYTLLKQPSQDVIPSVTIGLGHGGFECLISAGMPITMMVVAMVVAQFYPETLTTQGVDQSVIDSFWSTAWYVPVLGALGRLAMVGNHIFLSFLVMRVFQQKNYLYLLAAMAWHGVIYFMGMYLSSLNYSNELINLVLIGSGFISLYLLYLMVGKELIAAWTGQPKAKLAEE
ncbi:MAG TPA: YhfC family glutamic-type intramembrane protease [Anaerolineaceae bacterium]|nr:YhfC family glutamic-type intramembrane protease [Anaerolineaceae bacterium]HPN52432.1 YhfC family glutamic-type intramembrane protease [Anaerolineaceae bacterium]